MPEGSVRSAPKLDIPRLDTSTSFAKEAYAALKRAITAIDIYDHPDEVRLDEYSDANIAFHQAIIGMSGCALLAEMTENLFIHMRAIRKITIHQENRAARSISDHMRLIEALERRDAEFAECLARKHTLGLAAHVEQHGDFLDTTRE